MENNQNDFQVKRKRGRPKKEPPKEIISDSEKKLEMTANSNKVQVSTIEKDLHSLYTKIMGNEGKNCSNGWSSGDSVINLQSYNPFLQNQRLKNLSTLPSDMSREELLDALKAPQNSEQALRSQGQSLASSQYLYYKILRLAADIPLFNYYKIPELLDSKEYNESDFIQEDEFVDSWLEKFDPVNTLKRVSLEVKREGKPTYVLRNSITKKPDGTKVVNYATWQKLMPNYVKLIGIGECGYIASFNMLIFMNPAISPKQYPDFIQNIWEDMVNNKVVSKNAIGENVINKKSKKTGKNNNEYSVNIDLMKDYSYIYNNEYTGKTESLRGMIEYSKDRSWMFWVPMPQELCYTFCSDTSNVWALPDTTGLFLGLQELTDYDQLAGLIQSSPLTALLTAEAETIPQTPGLDQTVLSPETIVGLQDKFNESSSTNIEGFFAPLKNFKLLSLPNIPNSTEITTKATSNFISRAGLSGIIPTTDKPSVSLVKASQKLEESQCNFVTQQFKRVLQMIINKLIGCSYNWKLVLWGGVFTVDDEIKRDKELFVAGGTFVLPKLVSAYGINLRDTRALQRYIQSLDIYSDLKTITQEQQEKINQSKNQGTGAGRPEVSDNDIDNDNTAQSKEGGLDTSDMREFSEKQVEEALSNGKCIICGADADGLLCEECAEKYSITGE